MMCTKSTGFFRLGIFLVVFGTLLYGLACVLSAKVVEHVGTGNITAVQFVIQSLFCIPFFIKDPSAVMKPVARELIFMALSGISMGIAGLTGYFCYMYISPMDASTIVNSQPIVVIIISTLWLKEKVGIFDITAIVIMLVGVLCVCQPTFLFGIVQKEHSWIGYLSAGVSTVFLGLTICFVKRVSKNNPATILIIQTIMAVPLCFIWNSVFRDESDPSSLSDWAYFTCGTGLGAISRSCIIISLQFEPSYLISLLQINEILSTMVFQIVLLSIYPNWVGILGAILIISGVIIVVLKDNMLCCCGKPALKVHSRAEVEDISNEDQEINLFYNNIE